jgi:hypothetical protein
VLRPAYLREDEDLRDRAPGEIANTVCREIAEVAPEKE